VVAEMADRMGLVPAAKSTLRLLAKKRRLIAVPDIARQLARLVDEAENVVRAEVTSAGPLTDDYLGKLRAELEKATGKKVTIAHKQDKGLIGGVVTRVGDQVIDGSVRTRLAAFRESLLRS
jgi:F-type H+-transporting ATPase subunit delta